MECGRLNQRRGEVIALIAHICIHWYGERAGGEPSLTFLKTRSEEEGVTRSGSSDHFNAKVVLFRLNMVTEDHRKPREEVTFRLALHNLHFLTSWSSGSPRLERLTVTGHSVVSSWCPCFGVSWWRHHVRSREQNIFLRIRLWKYLHTQRSPREVLSEVLIP